MVLNSRIYTAVVKTSRKSKNCSVVQIMNCHGKYLPANVPNQKRSILSDKMSEVVKWYDEFTGMDEVRKAQNRVLEEEQNFRNAQEVRRNILVELNQIQSKIKEVYAELDSTSRGDDKYINLVTLEHKLLKEEKAIMERFSIAEKDERDSFASLSNSVKLSHEKERAQGERTKYWSLIGSVLGTILGVVGTSINNHFKMNELRELIKNSSDKVVTGNLKTLLEQNEKFLSEIKTSVNFNEVNGKINKTNIGQIESLLNKITSKLASLEEKSAIVKLSHKNNAASEEQSNSNFPVSGSDLTLQEMKAELAHTNTLIYVLAVISVIVPLLTKWSS